MLRRSMRSGQGAGLPDVDGRAHLFVLARQGRAPIQPEALCRALQCPFCSGQMRMAAEFGARRAEIVAFIEGLNEREKLIVLEYLSNGTDQVRELQEDCGRGSLPLCWQMERGTCSRSTSIAHRRSRHCLQPIRP